jgi:hypothetical protein
MGLDTRKIDKTRHGEVNEGCTIGSGDETGHHQGELHGHREAPMTEMSDTEGVRGNGAIPSGTGEKWDRRGNEAWIRTTATIGWNSHGSEVGKKSKKDPDIMLLISLLILIQLEMKMSKGTAQTSEIASRSQYMTWNPPTVSGQTMEGMTLREGWVFME